MMADVIILWGDQEVQAYYDYSARTPEVAKILLSKITVYKFDTEEEAEAFRLGLCEVKSPNAHEFSELPPAGYAALFTQCKEMMPDWLMKITGAKKSSKAA